ncbi:MAG TPA: 6-phosphofructokinase [Candidatus Binataceae bacterium]
MEVALGGGAEAVIVPEFPCSIDDLCRRIAESQARGKRSSIIEISEGPRTGGAIPIAALVSARLNMPARTVVLGHIQRGGALPPATACSRAGWALRRYARSSTIRPRC